MCVRGLLTSSHTHARYHVNKDRRLMQRSCIRFYDNPERTFGEGV